MNDAQRVLATPCPACGAWGVLCFPQGVHAIRRDRAKAEARAVAAQAREYAALMHRASQNENRRAAIAASSPLDMLVAAQGHVRNTWTRRQADRYVKLTAGE